MSPARAPPGDGVRLARTGGAAGIEAVREHLREGTIGPVAGTFGPAARGQSGRASVAAGRGTKIMMRTRVADVVADQETSVTAGALDDLLGDAPLELSQRITGLDRRLLAPAKLPA